MNGSCSLFGRSTLKLVFNFVFNRFILIYPFLFFSPQLKCACMSGRDRKFSSGTLYILTNVFAKSKNVRTFEKRGICYVIAQVYHWLVLYFTYFSFWTFNLSNFPLLLFIFIACLFYHAWIWILFLVWYSFFFAWTLSFALLFRVRLWH